MPRTVHVCLSVRGALNWSRRELKRATRWIFRDDGSRYTPDELREALMDELAQGHEVIPMAQECEGFDYSGGGCPGHERPEPANGGRDA